MDFELLTQTLDALGEPGFRARQIWAAVAKGTPAYADMTDLPARLRVILEERVPFSTLEVQSEAHSRDGTLKVLFRTGDGRPVEAVLMRYRDGRRSLCLSSQSGCPLTCTFCATGSMRFGRNLSACEILDQALHFRRLTAVGRRGREGNSATRHSKNSHSRSASTGSSSRSPSENPGTSTRSLPANDAGARLNSQV